MTLVDALFGKQLNNIIKKAISDDPRSTSLLTVLKKRVCDLFIFSEHIVHVFLAIRNRGGPFRGMLRRSIEHFLKKRKFGKVGFSEIN